MGLSRERKIFAGVLGVALIALVVDQGFLQPGSAGAAVPAVPDSAGAPGPAGVPSVGEVVGAESGQARSLAHVAARLREVGMSGKGPGDAFKLPDEWFGALGTPPVATRAGAADAAAGIELTALMPSPNGGVAVINGTPVRVGEMVGDTGYRLVGLTSGGAILGNSAGTIQITLPNANYMPGSAAPRPGRG